MRARQLEGIGRIGFGAGQIADDSCGPVDEASAMHALSAPADAGANQVGRIDDAVAAPR